MEESVKKPRWKKIIIPIFIFLIALLISFTVWLYRGSITETKLKTLSLLQLPIGMVNNHFLPANAFVSKFKLAQTLVDKNVFNDSIPQIQASIIKQLVYNAKISELANKLGISVSQKQIDAEYLDRSNNSDLLGKNNFQQELKNYGLTTQDFKEQIIKPELLILNLQTWFNSQSNLNSEAYSKASSLISQIQSGGDMASLAVNYSQDSAGQKSQGDLGFVDVYKLLPEVKEQVDSLKLGEIKIIPSRLGLHIIRLEGKNGNTPHLRQIFLKANDFQMWYNNETKDYSVKLFIKI